MRSRRPLCFSPPTTAATSRERDCLWMAASRKYRPGLVEAIRGEWVRSQREEPVGTGSPVSEDDSGEPSPVSETQSAIVERPFLAAMPAFVRAYLTRDVPPRAFGFHKCPKKCVRTTQSNQKLRSGRATAN